jgi:hypothetical protein
MERDPWLDPLRKNRDFSKLLREAEAHHRQAVATFGRMQGDQVLGVALPFKAGR